MHHQTVRTYDRRRAVGRDEANRFARDSGHGRPRVWDALGVRARDRQQNATANSRPEVVHVADGWSGQPGLEADGQAVGHHPR